jgi:hypothetical protein
MLSASNSSDGGPDLRVQSLMVLLVAAWSAVWGAAPFSKASADTVYLLLTPHLQCLTQHAAAYLAEDKRAYVISLPKCPDPVVDFRDYVTNSAPDFKLQDRPHDLLIVLTRPQLECLADVPIDPTMPFHRLWPAQCKVEARASD